MTACYSLTVLALGAAAIETGVGAAFWPCWCVAATAMVLEPRRLQSLSQQPMSVYGRHFKHQVWLGGLLLFGLVLGGLQG